MSKEEKRFVREIAEVTEFYVTEDNEAKYNTIYKKTPDGVVYRRNPSKYLIEYLEAQGVKLPNNFIREDLPNPGDEAKKESMDDYMRDISSNQVLEKNTTNNKKNDEIIFG